MQDEIVFYYVVYNNDIYKTNQPFWNNLIISLITLRNCYPENKIVVITYEEKQIPDIIKLLSNKMNFSIVINKPAHFYDDVTKINYRMLSRHVNCYNIASTKNEKIIYIDTDVFIMKPFTNFNWNKVGLLTDSLTQVNGGVVYMNSESEAAKKFVNFIDSELKDILANKYDRMEYIKKVYPLCGEHCGIQEETMLRNFVSRDRNSFMEIFYNIGDKNNATVNYKKITETDILKNLNNIHLMVDPPARLVELVSSIEPFKKIIYDNPYINMFFAGLDKSIIKNNQLKFLR